MSHLKAFLDANNLTAQFEHNYMQSKNPQCFSSFFHENESSRHAINGAFEWDKTPENYHFWQDVDKHYRETFYDPMRDTQVAEKVAEKPKTIDPLHYTHAAVETIEVIEMFKFGHHLGCAFKYMARLGKKEDDLADIQKAIWYLRRKEELIRSENDQKKPCKPIDMVKI